MRSLALLAAVLLAGCGPADGYQFERKEFERAAPNITVVTHPSLKALRDAAPASAKEGAAELQAWSAITSRGCEMHIVDPTQSYQPEWIGHEAAHCVYGRWHK
ncbi:hypothetical protein [Sphingopyxis flava]|uniref:Lipoprotein n=1 Tax=Sphingopyxis flava TaxID=1507287 RepID=A0A1T5CRJ4_9SPHN|nr:hypothetical protein [Sphingopyxis flava]SKB62105.1 hypothetical protein SAMN06295937_101155 [Sphingopyxis flava]